jgi:hypothetical protein
MLLVLMSGLGDVALGPDSAVRLAALGVSSVSLVRDDESIGVVLEGWAFDPAVSGADATAILAGENAAVRTLRPVMHLAVRP